MDSRGVNARGRVTLRLKRLVDIVGAITALATFSPVIVAVSLIILAIDGPPLLHRDPRVGRYGKVFGLLKFRTLRPHTEAERSVAPEDDPRITKPGLWLRRWRLDELPQLVNVLAGDMSLVGPRPIRPDHAETLPNTDRAELLAVRPGMTDPAAVYFLAEDAVLAGHTDAEAIYVQRILPVKTAMQLDYIRRWSLFEDLRVILRTLRWVWSPAQRRRSARALQRLLD